MNVVNTGTVNVYAYTVTKNLTIMCESGIGALYS